MDCCTTNEFLTTKLGRHAKGDGIMPNPQLQTYNPKWRGTIVDDGGDQTRATNAAIWIFAPPMDFLLPSWDLML
jgi:hypothetical protein